VGVVSQKSSRTAAIFLFAEDSIFKLGELSVQPSPGQKSQIMSIRFIVMAVAFYCICGRQDNRRGAQATARFTQTPVDFPHQ
jgi:hypothetical protein